MTTEDAEGPTPPTGTLATTAEETAAAAEECGIEVAVGAVDMAGGTTYEVIWGWG